MLDSLGRAVIDGGELPSFETDVQFEAADSLGKAHSGKRDIVENLQPVNCIVDGWYS